MSIMDYGAILRVNGKFVNKNEDLFMEKSDTGYVCEKALHDDGKYYDIDGDYFVYAGDEDLLFCFYKGMAKAVSHNKVIWTGWNFPFKSETFYINDNVKITVKRLDSKYYVDYIPHIDQNDYEYMVYKRGKRRADIWRNRFYKNIHMVLSGRCGSYTRRSYRFLAEWEHNGKSYEVIFGSGIDPDEQVWENIKNTSYNFSKTEIEIIDSWFNED